MKKGERHHSEGGWVEGNFKWTGDAQADEIDSAICHDSLPVKLAGFDLNIFNAANQFLKLPITLILICCETIEGNAA